MTTVPDLTRDFGVAVLVVRQRRILMHYHRRLGRWLPPGGHIEPNELPDDAARREVMEETGLTVNLIGGYGLPVAGDGLPRQLTRPAGIQLADIGPDHQHIDLIYFATLRPGVRAEPLPDGAGWFAAADLDALNLTEEVHAWCARALREIEPADDTD